MAPRLQARGFQVNVYANVPRNQRGIDRNTQVNWQHFGAYDFETERDTAIYWRSPEMLENKMGYRKRIVWCHDVQDPSRWTDARILLADQVWVLTDFHATTLGAARAKLGDKVRITRNGIDSAFLRSVLGLKLPRNPKKIIYASSPDRGVQTAMKIFEAAKKIDPALDLHIFYGFNKLFIEQAARIQYGSIPDLGRDANMFEYWSESLRLADRLEIPWHGRVGWAELAKEMTTAGVWLYPTRFPEISCMSLMEAMALGCIPVHSGKFALAETGGDCGFRVDPDDVSGAAKVLIEAASIPADSVSRPIISDSALETFDYEKLADEWVELLKD
jgi:glycosyltransferase involved in cell wall biosynthesis